MYKICNFLLNIFFPQICDACKQKHVHFLQPMCFLCLDKMEKTLSSKNVLFRQAIIGVSEQDVFYVFKYQFLSSILLTRVKMYKEIGSMLYLLKFIEKNYIDILRRKKIDYYSVIPSSSLFITSLSKSLFKKTLGITPIKLFKIKKNALHQKELSREKRFQNIYENLYLIDDNISKSLQQKKLLIVDDVYTTGATMKRAFSLLELCDLSECLCFTVFARERQHSQQF